MRLSSIVLVWLVAGAVVAGCDYDRTRQQRQRIAALALAEAGKIDQPVERLRRLLNVADSQANYTYQPRQARQTLGEAVKLLDESGEQIDMEARLAGWVSVAELAINAQDKPLAVASLDKALAQLRTIEPPARRCQYVLSIASGVNTLHGADRAAALVREAAGWAMGLTEVLQERREALASFADRLVDLGREQDALEVLRHEGDAAWRTDMLVQLSKRGYWSGTKNFGVRINPVRHSDCIETRSVLFDHLNAI